MQEDEIQEMRTLFLQEMEELLERIEADMLVLESHPDDSGMINGLFRHFHTIKGGAGMAGFPPLAEFTHAVENLLDRVRSGEVSTSGDLVSVLLESLDCLKNFMEDAQGLRPLDSERIHACLASIQQFGGGVAAAPVVQMSPPAVAPPKPEVVTVEPTPERLFLIRLRFQSNLFASRTDPMVLVKDLEVLGEMRIIPHPHVVPPLDQFDPTQLYLWWSIHLRTQASRQRIESILMFFLEDHDIRIDEVAGPPQSPEDQAAIDASVAGGSDAVSPVPVSSLSPPSIPAIPSASPGQAARPSLQMEKKEPPGKSISPQDRESRAPSSIRVDIQKLDKLINLVGEIVIIQSRLNQTRAEVFALDEEMGERLLHVLDDHDRVVQELREQSMKVRMVPIGGTFLPLRRLVRDFAGRSGKQIRMVTAGEETEIDKTIIEQLSGPLKHLVRNALDHGLEMPDERQRAGKSPEGTISLSAVSKRGSIFVEISDDGAGIDSAKVLAVARRKGLVDPEETLSDPEIHQLLFRSGFSTSEQVTAISGRGVGMDVVRQEIEALHGSVEIESRQGEGSRFRIKLPLTLAIIEGMLVKVGERIFVIPLLSVVESLRPRPEQYRTLKHRGELIRVRKEYIPLLRLHRFFGLETTMTDPAKALLVIVEDAGHKSCLLVDEIIDQQQVVIKSLEENMMHVDGFAGATILGDGRVSLILDIPALIRYIPLKTSMEKTA